MSTGTSYAAGPTEPPLLEETIGANLERVVAEHGDRDALVERSTGRRWTYAELNADVDALARGLIAADIAKGDRIGIWAPNCAEWTLVQYAAAKAGAGRWVIVVSGAVNLVLGLVIVALKAGLSH